MLTQTLTKTNLLKRFLIRKENKERQIFQSSSRKKSFIHSIYCNLWSYFWQRSWNIHQETSHNFVKKMEIQLFSSNNIHQSSNAGVHSSICQFVYSRISKPLERSWLCGCSSLPTKYTGFWIESLCLWKPRILSSCHVFLFFYYRKQTYFDNNIIVFYE